MTAKNGDPPLSILLPNSGGMTADEIRAYIARTRRLLDRFDRLPDGVPNPISTAQAEEIRLLCDQLEFSLYNTDQSRTHRSHPRAFPGAILANGVLTHWQLGRPTARVAHREMPLGRAGMLGVFMGVMPLAGASLGAELLTSCAGPD